MTQLLEGVSNLIEEMIRASAVTPTSELTKSTSEQEFINDTKKIKSPMGVLTNTNKQVTQKNYQKMK